MPLSDDASFVHAYRLDLDDPLGPQPLLWKTTHGCRLLRCLLLPGESQDVAIRQRFDVVVQRPLLVNHPPLPDDLAVPVDPLQEAADAAGAEVRRFGELARTQCGAVVLEVGIVKLGASRPIRPQDMG